MAKRIKKYLEYSVVIAPDTRTGSDKKCFTAFVPALGIATDADTVEEAFARIKKLITFHLESLRKEDKTIPLERGESEFVATARIPLSV